MAQLRSRRCTSGAANRSGSAVNGRARLMSNGPVTPGEGTDHVQYSPDVPIRRGVISCGRQVKTRTACPSMTLLWSTSSWPKPAPGRTEEVRPPGDQVMAAGVGHHPIIVPVGTDGAGGEEQVPPSPAGSARTSGSRHVSLLPSRSGPAVSGGARSSVLYQRGSTGSTGWCDVRRQWWRPSETADPMRWSKMWWPAVEMAV